VLSTQQRHEILKWAHESTANHLFRYDQYTNVDDTETEEEQEAEEEAIEKEHQDYLLLKAEEYEQNKKGGF